MTYRNVCLSDERDGIRLLTFRSPALEGRGDVSLCVPDGEGLPLIVLLHGVYGSHWSWTHSGRAHLTARELIQSRAMRPMVLAMPSDGLAGDGTGYVSRYERWIIEDVVGCVREVVPSAAGPLFLAGLSMGGYGALRLGTKHADRVRAVSAHSTLTALSQLAHFTSDPLPPPEPDHDILHWIDAHRGRLPGLRFDCGTDDPVLPASRALHRALDERRIPHEYAEFPGGHDWTYWTRHLRDSLLFFEQSARASYDHAMSRPAHDELLKLVDDGTLEAHVRGTMRDFCFAISAHEGRQRTWFGDYTVTINRNVAFNFFTADVREDPGLEPYPVVRAERTETVDLRGPDGVVPAFYLAAADWRAAVESIERIDSEYAGVRLLPDVWFEDEPLVRLLRERLLVHPVVAAERAADWPPLLR